MQLVDLGHAASRPSDLRVGKVGLSFKFNWTVKKLGICLRINHKITLREMGTNHEINYKKLMSQNLLIFNQ